MFTLLIIFHLLAALVLILVVLLQSGKAGDLASTFGGVGTQTAFGARGAATLLTKATTVCAVIFMLTSLGLSIMYTESTGTVMEGAPYEDVPSTSPAQTAPRPQDQPDQALPQPESAQPSDPGSQSQPQQAPPQQ